MKKIFIYGDGQKLVNYAQAVKACGAAPVISMQLEEAAGADALVLAGGGDLDPALYGQANTGSLQIDRRRDADEIRLVRQFRKSGRPILGICRGIQLLNVAWGGDLIQDIPNSGRHAYNEETGDQIHEIQCAAGSFLYDLYGGHFSVNSAHHQACGACGSGLAYTARADDGTVEALENAERTILGVQFHPERMAFGHTCPDTVDGRALWEYFLTRL